jgi:acetyl-CoA C-acetyltransferase
VGIDDVEVLDLYSCFPSAVELGAAALGLATDDSRGLTSTGGLPYFGGPGNNYTAHGIAAVTERLRHETSPGAGAAAGRSGVRLGLATGLGWFITKHAVGVYGSAPPPTGFHRGDTAADQRAIDESAAEVALELESRSRSRSGSESATVLAATVARNGAGGPDSAPVIARLPDGRQMALAAADGETIAAMGETDIPGLVGQTVVVQAGAARYRLATG